MYYHAFFDGSKHKFGVMSLVRLLLCALLSLTDHQHITTTAWAGNDVRQYIVQFAQTGLWMRILQLI